MKRAIKIDSLDNVAVVVQDICRGELVDCAECNVTAAEEIPLGHKIALSAVSKGELLVKYGVPIGRAVVDINAGEHVHIQNVEDITEELCEQYQAKYRAHGDDVNGNDTWL
jgi:altronate hydrolase